MTRAGPPSSKRVPVAELPQDDGDSFRWRKLNESLSATDPEDSGSLRDALAAVYATIAGINDAILQEFECFTELMLGGDGARAGEVACGRIRVEEGRDREATLLDAARLLRAIEANLVEFGRFVESDLGEDLEAAWRTSDGCHYVVPRITPLAPADGKPFLRRALRHHRIVPTELEKFKVRLHRAPLAFGSQTAGNERGATRRRYGAGLFPGLNVKLAHPQDGLFTVERLEGCDAHEQIGLHLSEARQAGCTTVVWGELTMAEGSVAFLQADLVDNALSTAFPFRFLVAGSWHREVKGRMRNVATILDGLGEPIFEVFKWAKFKIDGCREAIEAGDEVHVLVDEDELVVIAICRDFLQDTGDVPYRKLDVDVAVIPSMTAGVPDAKTMSGHRGTANTMRVRFGTRTLVVAQPAYAQPGAIGEVLAFPANPLITAAEPVHSAFHLCSLERP